MQVILELFKEFFKFIFLLLLLDINPLLHEVYTVIEPLSYLTSSRFKIKRFMVILLLFVCYLCEHLLCVCAHTHQWSQKTSEYLEQKFSTCES